MFAHLNLAVMSDGEIAQLSETLYRAMVERTGTRFWEEIDTPYTQNMSQWIGWIDAELNERYMQELFDVPECSEGGIPNSPDCEGCPREDCSHHRDWSFRTCKHSGRVHLGSVLNEFAIAYHEGQDVYGYSRGEAFGYARDQVGFSFGADEPCGYLDRVMERAGYEIELYPLGGAGTINEEPPF